VGVTANAVGPASPPIKKQVLGASRFMRITDNRLAMTLETRLWCAEVNIDPNF